jgi:hypothetical protein
MFDQESTVVAQRLGLDVVIDEFPIAVGTVDIRSTAQRRGIAE